METGERGYLITGKDSVVGPFDVGGGEVPLVAAGIEMYDLPINDPFWLLLAYCAGTGGSCLIIGSAAGIAAINFVWYVKHFTP